MRKLTILIAVLLLTACATAPDVSDKGVDTRYRTVPEIPAERTAEQLYAQARQAPLHQQPLLLLQAVMVWQQQGDCQSALKVLQPLIPELRDATQRDQARLIRSQCLLELDKPALASASLEKVSNNIHILPARLKLSAELAEYHRQYLNAARSHAELISLDPSRAESGYRKIWQLLEQVDNKDLPEVAAQPGYLAPWLELARITRTVPGVELSQRINLWQQQYPDYSLPEPVQQMLQQAHYQPQNIAVILPLSGRLANQGQALKEGILAAYFDTSQPREHKTQLTFYDSVVLDETEIQTLALQHDFVLGPLIRENIPAILSQLPQSTPALLLNRLEQEEVSPHRYFYSLAPEDEAEQLASYLYANGYRRPVLISAKRQLFERMAEHFMRRWQTLDKSEPSLMTFTDNKSMRDAVDSLLDIQQSERRINQLQRLVNKEIHSFARNRRDVDAIVVFSNPAQTELLNPMIESSISPFASIVPVFASSRSFSKELGNNSLRDLRNLMFVDMPWMLPGTNAQIKERVNQLWPDRNDSQSRLFAMGYDAYQLVPELTTLHYIKGRQLQGLTGQLSMDRQQRIVRRLPFGKIEQDKVISLAGD
ncbi:penicillin-binding protein activator [Lacimicrobium alkaliphilum]|uniref:LppC family lipoprotein n=1 Tax=Lacimicrobium alkaliphilum TaxID=1526571 RepID=A0A0U2RQK6_9ALTE|nr:penicillin-binding protein activator [Lacimicrobium alkaliphilum]ALS99674.1 hypothetical protein AT746_16320 [Lacimicrobium alkaliphilum]